MYFAVRSLKHISIYVYVTGFAKTRHLRGYPPPPTLHPYRSACGLYKKQSKMAGKSASCGLCSG